MASPEKNEHQHIQEDNEGWDEIESDQEQAPEEPSTGVIREQKKPPEKNKYGEIIIKELPEYREPTKKKIEKKGDIRDTTKNDFQELSVPREDEEPEKEEESEEGKKDEDEEPDTIGELGKHRKKKHIIPSKKDKKEDLDQILKDMGVEPVTPKEDTQENIEEMKKPEEGQNPSTEGKLEQRNQPQEKKKMKMPSIATSLKKSSHVSEMKKEILERKEAVKKKDKKKGLM